MKTVIIKSYLLLPQHKDPVTLKYEINQQLQTVNYCNRCCNNNDDRDDNTPATAAAAVAAAATAAVAAAAILRQYVPRRPCVITGN